MRTEAANAVRGGKGTEIGRGGSKAAVEWLGVVNVETGVGRGGSDGDGGGRETDNLGPKWKVREFAHDDIELSAASKTLSKEEDAVVILTRDAEGGALGRDATVVFCGEADRLKIAIEGDEIGLLWMTVDAAGADTGILGDFFLLGSDLGDELL